MAIVAEKKRILLAEDDDELRDILGFWLEGEGYEVVTASNGWEAIKQAKETAPSAVVLDLLMPHVDGYQACLYMKNDPEVSQIPIVMFSAVFVDDDEKQLGYEVGADEFVAKTSGFNSLLAAIDRLTEQPLALRPPINGKVAALVRSEIEAVAAKEKL